MGRLLALAMLAALAGCTQSAPLKPAPGQSLPVKPLMARTTPTPAELLAVPNIARPQRVDELMRKSEPRQSDRFDLPPPAGGAAPTVAGSDPQPVSSDDDTGRVQKQ
ncbi:MAG: hypothetical protein ABIQ32_05105 [Sphingomicrobium sp.]